jgi:hypothetical protein
MTGRIEQIMRRAGPPEWIVIYPDAESIWRYAIYHTREIADGRLDVGSAATPQIARHVGEALLREICNRFYPSMTPTVDWKAADDKGMITGHVHTASS